MSADYHKYVFDQTKREFIGDFNEMYKSEESGDYDSWFQENLNHITKRIALAVLSEYNFHRIVDLGCGKGNFTHLFKKKNNHILGVDISEEAINKARRRFPEIIWKIGKTEELHSIMKSIQWEGADLLLALEVLSYVENWREMIARYSNLFEYIYISLYIPENPIGFVKTKEDILEILRKYFKPNLELYSMDKQVLYWFGQRKTDV